MNPAHSIVTTVVGAGSWGTALAVVLARQGHSVNLWVYETDLCHALATDRQNFTYLPGISIPNSVRPTQDMATAACHAQAVILAVPSHVLRGISQRLKPCIGDGVPLIIATKGLEERTLMRVSEVVVDVLGQSTSQRLATLSGPTFAREVAKDEPAAVVIAAVNSNLGKQLQKLFSSPTLRLYTSNDTVGVELCASLKNVIAIASGVCEGLGLGSNTRAALIARGLAEIGRLVEACGGRKNTVSGLAGLGDLVLTCTGELSRNRSVGVALGQGRSLAESLAQTPMVAEGVRTSSAAVQLAAKHEIEMPITEQIHRVLFENLSPRTALAELMHRLPRGED